MLLFPQLQSGAIAQFPFTNSCAVSLTTNLQEDGWRYLSSSTSPTRVTWTLTYPHLTQDEANTLNSFFLSAHGRLLPFTFLDPAGNLALWSEDFTQPVWAKSPLVTTTSQKQGELTVSQVGGLSAGANIISQTLTCQEAALVCFSVYAKADQPTVLKLSVSNSDRLFHLTANWTRYFITQAGTGSNTFKTVQLSFEGGPIDLSRLTVSPQPAPGSYVVSRETSGVMANARFDQDNLSFSMLGENDLSCKVRITTQLT